MIYVIRCQHTPYLSSFINLIITKSEFKWKYAKLICSKSQDQMKKQSNLMFHLNISVLQYIIFTDGLSIWEIFDLLFKDLWTYLFIITCLNITKTFYLINSKNVTGEFYAITAPGLWTLPLLILLKICLSIFQKM